MARVPTPTSKNLFPFVGQRLEIPSNYDLDAYYYNVHARRVTIEKYKGSEHTSNLNHRVSVVYEQ